MTAATADDKQECDEKLTKKTVIIQLNVDYSIFIPRHWPVAVQVQKVLAQMYVANTVCVRANIFWCAMNHCTFESSMSIVCEPTSRLSFALHCKRSVDGVAAKRTSAIAEHLDESIDYMVGTYHTRTNSSESNEHNRSRISSGHVMETYSHHFTTHFEINY